MQEEKSLKKNVALNFANTFLSLCFPLITFPYSSRILLPQGIGHVHFAQSIIHYFGLLAGLGITMYGIRESAKRRDDKYELSKFTKEIFIISSISSIATYLLFLISLIYVPKFSEYKSVLLICSSTLLLSPIAMEWLNDGLEEFKYKTIRSIVFQSLSVILLFVIVKKSDDYEQYAFVAIFGIIGTDICNIIHTRKYVSFKIVERIELKKHIKPIMTFFSMTAAVYVYTALDTTMLGFLADDFQIGFYSAATKINRMVLTLVTSIGAVFFPRLSYYANTKTKVEFEELVKKTFSLLFIISLPCCVGLCILAQPIVLLFSGENYLPSVFVMRVMNPIIVIVGISNLIGTQILVPLGKEKWQFFATVLAAVSNFTLNLILVPKYKALGAAIGTLGAETISMIVQIAVSVKIINYKKPVLDFLRALFNVCIMAIPVVACLFCIENNIFKIIFGVASGIVTYFLMLLIERDEFVMNFLILKIKNKFNRTVEVGVGND